jgi:biopolymer transport protein ExbD
MFQSIRTAKRQKEPPQIRITPLIDMVFILLIFFIVTASFVSDAGLNVKRPRAGSAQPLAARSIKIAIDAKGQIFLSGQRLSLLSLRPLIKARLIASPDIPAVIIADKATPADIIVKVMDELRLSGIQKIALAAEKI